MLGTVRLDGGLDVNAHAILIGYAHCVTLMFRWLPLCQQDFSQIVK